MKYASLLLITSWACYVLITTPDLKPSDNFLLFTLSCLSIMYSVVNIIILILKFKK